MAGPESFFWGGGEGANHCIGQHPQVHNPRVTMTEYEEDVIGIRRPEFRGGGI